MIDPTIWLMFILGFIFVGGIFLTAHMMGPPDSIDNKSLKTK